MARLAVLPDPAKTTHLVGDLHAGAVSTVRTNKLIADLTAGVVPGVACHVQIGDSVDAGLVSQDTIAKALYAQITDAPVRAIPGNHDTWGVRTTAQWATSMAAYLEGGVYPYVKDLGFARLIAVGDFYDGTIPGDPSPARPYLPQTHLDYLDAALAAAGTQDCWVLSHAPLENTVTGPITGDNPQFSSAETYFFAHGPDPASADDSAIRAVLAAHPNAKAWFCGHTHSDIQAPGFLSTLTLGGRSFAHVNLSAIYYVGRVSEPLTDPIRSIYATRPSLSSSNIEIRVRDHGQGCWVGIFGSRVTTMAVT